jgi:ribulose-phosphate 3-epimerase
VINPATEIDGLIPFLSEVDLILLMTVNPGFGGQSFMESVMEKARKLSQIREDEGLQFLLEVDGGVGPEHVDLCLDAGVDVLVAGTAYYKRDAVGRRDFAQIVGEC